MAKKYFCLTTFLGLLLFGVGINIALAQTELLTNGNAEADGVTEPPNGTTNQHLITGWTQPYPDTQSWAENSPSSYGLSGVPHGGSYVFIPYGNDQSSLVYTWPMYQVVNITDSGRQSAIDAGNATVDFVAFLKSYASGDQGRVQVQYFSGSNAGGSLLGSFDSGKLSPLNIWQSITDSRTVPTGTRSIKVQINGYRSGNGYCDIAFDDLSLKITTTAPEIAVSGNSTEITDGDTSPSTSDNTDFGSQTAASGTISQTFTITNTGNAGLTLNGSPKVAISGTNASDFTVTSQPSSPVSSGGGTTTFTIKFDPGAIGTRTASVSIDNDDSNENPYNFDIQGTGINSAPTTTDTTWVTVEKTDHTLAKANFPFSDADNADVLSSVQINTLPTNGTLYKDADLSGSNNSETIVAGQTITASEIQNGKLRYVSPSSGSGYEYDSFTFKVNDGTDYSTAKTFYVSVEDTTVTFSGTSGADAWHLVANPFQTTLSSLFSNIWTQGATNSSHPSGDANIFTYDESTSSFKAVTGDLTSITPSAGTGYAVYMFADDDYSTPGTVNGDWPKTLSTKGTIHGSTVSIPVSNTDQNSNSSTDNDEGWNLIGNPYGTNISVDSVIASLSRVDALVNVNVYIWDPSAGSYTTLSPGNSKGIAPYQSFFIRLETSGNSGNLVLKNDDRTSNTSTVYKQTQQSPQITFSVKGNKLSAKGGFTFKSGSSRDLNPLDAYQLWPMSSSHYMMIYTQADGQNIMKKYLPNNFDKIQSWPVYIKSSVTGQISLSWKTTNLPSDWKVTLRDSKTGETINLANQTNYSFRNSTTPKKTKISSDNIKYHVLSKHDSSSTSRFRLTIVPHADQAQKATDLPSKITLDQNYPNPFNPTTQIHYTLPQQQNVSLAIYDLLGRKVATLVNGSQSKGAHTIRWDASQRASGMYIYRLKAGDKVISHQMMLIK